MHTVIILYVNEKGLQAPQFKFWGCLMVSGQLLVAPKPSIMHVATLNTKKS